MPSEGAFCGDLWCSVPVSGAWVSRRQWVLGLLGLLGSACRSSGNAPQKDAGAPRVVSLSPALTETLFAIGAGVQLVGVSDFCVLPPGSALPRVGTSLTPSVEGLVRLHPTLIVTQQAAGATGAEKLGRIAPTRALPWLTLPEVVSGTRTLGALTATKAKADALAERLNQALSVEAPEGGVEVLLVLGVSGARLDEVWFVRRNSLHGAALHAAGGRNAVGRDVAGQPRLSLEALVRLDPPAIVVLTAGAETDPSADEIVNRWAKLGTLRAVKSRRLRVLRSPAAFSDGPGILTLVDELAPLLKGLVGS